MPSFPYIPLQRDELSLIFSNNEIMYKLEGGFKEMITLSIKRKVFGDFPGGPETNLSSQCRGPGSSPVRELDPACLN